MTNAILVACVFIAVFLTGYTAISVFNRNGARLGVLTVDAVAITAVISHFLGVW